MEGVKFDKGIEDSSGLFDNEKDAGEELSDEDDDDSPSVTSDPWISRIVSQVGIP